MSHFNNELLHFCKKHYIFCQILNNLAEPYSKSQQNKGLYGAIRNFNYMLNSQLEVYCSFFKGNLRILQTSV